MRLKLVLLSVLLPIFVLLAPTLAKAQNTSDAFAQYTNPHAICDYYRSGQANFQTGNGTARFVVERESDNECLVSIGSGNSKSFTQYYYSGNDWCYKLYSGSEVVSSLCVQRPDKSIDFTKYEPYVIVGVVIFAFVVTVGAISSNKPPTTPEPPANEGLPTYSQPKSVRSKVRKPNKRSRIWNELGRKK